MGGGRTQKNFVVWKTVLSGDDSGSIDAEHSRHETASEAWAAAYRLRNLYGVSDGALGNWVLSVRVEDISKITTAA